MMEEPPSDCVPERAGTLTVCMEDAIGLAVLLDFQLSGIESKEAGKT